MTKEEVSYLFLRVGVAFAFIYPAVSAYFNPLSWVGFFPAFVLNIFPNDTFLLQMFGISEIIIALWILSGKKIFIPSILATVYLLLIVAFNGQIFDVVFRDIPIALMALALLFHAHRQKDI